MWSRQHPLEDSLGNGIKWVGLVISKWQEADSQGWGIQEWWNKLTKIKQEKNPKQRPGLQGCYYDQMPLKAGMKRTNKHIIFLYEGSCLPHEAVSLNHDPETGMAPTPTPWADFRRTQGFILNISQNPITYKFWLTLKLQNYVFLCSRPEKI